MAAFYGFEFLYGLFDIVLCRIAFCDFHLCGYDPHGSRVLVVAQDQKFSECVGIVAHFKIIFCDGILDAGFFVFHGHDFEQGPKFCDGLFVVAFVGQVNGADVDAGAQGEAVLGKFSDELARKVDGEVIGVEVAVIFCEFVEDVGFFGLGDAFFNGVAIRACREVVFFVAFPKFGEFDIGINPVRAVGIIFYECGECVEIGLVVAVFVGSFVVVGADDVITRVGRCFGGGVFF